MSLLPLRASKALTLAAALGLTALCAGVPHARASMSLLASLAELVAEADDVVVVTTVAKHSHYDEDGRIVTDVELSIESSEKGDTHSGETVLVRRLGGEVDGIGMLVVGEPSFELGDRQLMFLRRASSQPWRSTVAMSQGRMPLVQRDGETWVEKGGAGLTMYRRDSRGTLKQASAPGPRRLSDMLDEIRTLVQAEGDTE